MPPQLKEVEQNLHALAEKKEEAIREGNFSRARELQEGQKELEESYEKLKKRQEQRYKNKKMQVTEENIAQIVSNWTKIPVQKLAQKESKRLASLEKELHKRVIGQEEAGGSGGKSNQAWTRGAERSVKADRFFPVSRTDRCW